MILERNKYVSISETDEDEIVVEAMVTVNTMHSFV